MSTDLAKGRYALSGYCHPGIYSALKETFYQFSSQMTVCCLVLITCPAAESSWISKNFLMFNSDKTEIVVFRSKVHRDDIIQALPSQSLLCTVEARNQSF